MGDRAQFGLELRHHPPQRLHARADALDALMAAVGLFDELCGPSRRVPASSLRVSTSPPPLQKKMGERRGGQLPHRQTIRSQTPQCRPAASPLCRRRTRVRARSVGDPDSVSMPRTADVGDVRRRPLLPRESCRLVVFSRTSLTGPVNEGPGSLAPSSGGGARITRLCIGIVRRAGDRLPRLERLPRDHRANAAGAVQGWLLSHDVRRAHTGRAPTKGWSGQIFHS